MTEPLRAPRGVRSHRQATRTPKTIGVLICSYRRPDNLARCLAALASQVLPPDDVLVICRDDDAKTRAFLAERPQDGLPLRSIVVSQPGTVHALNTGLDAHRTDVLAIADDDTVAQPQWLRCIMDHFVADPSVGGVGGRDRCHDGTSFDDRRKATVGRLEWLGRNVAYHHLGFGPAREVENLKGANMAYRAEAFATVRFDTRLRGTGAQPFEDMSFSMRIRRAGWKLIYDPAALVHHFAGPRDDVRHYSGVQAVTDRRGFRDCAFNYTLAVWDDMSPLRRAAFIGWSFAIGTGVMPGLVQALRYTPSLGRGSWERMLLTQQGRLDAYRLLMRRRPRQQQALGIPTASPQD